MKKGVTFRRRARRRGTRSTIAIALALALAALVVSLWREPTAVDGDWPGQVFDREAPRAVPQERESAGGTPVGGARDAAVAGALFERCGSGPRVNCVVDGDTFWYRGEKIRIADINTPEVSQPECAREAQLGAAATARLTDLLNAGAFTLETEGRDRDRYGRLLRVVERDGESLGAVLVREGLAEEWQGRRGGWC